MPRVLIERYRFEDGNVWVTEQHTEVAMADEHERVPGTCPRCGAWIASARAATGSRTHPATYPARQR